ncbi:TIGR02688 family protein [Spiribacter sp. SSL99]|uniref:BREX system Lon protease-like protein BrxL n=1 Tax=Spiribacter sp. SSL99 TaxID=1866884 RepID=UPI0013300AEF|nr:BREX system Lon protease-like protein BrxL [Spiribacter sp. SSL99]KAF0285840.1 TIGR02688 family protein [Spiribacter sp. SSL99]
MSVELDAIDNLAVGALDGYLVRKDLVRTFSRQFPVPTYVVEFLLGRYCASVDPDEINEGLEIVQRQLQSRTVKAGEEELFKSRAREQGEIKLIDMLTARLDTKTDTYIATLPSLRIKDARISAELANAHERMFTGGFYAEITLAYDAAIAVEQNGRPFAVGGLREIQLSSRDVLEKLGEARNQFSTAQWKDFLLRSTGIEPGALSEREKDALMLRMVPFVERNYNLVELGPRGTGKSHLFQQVSPYAHLISGGKATVAKMFVNNANGQRGLVCQYDVVCFDEVSGISFDQKDGVNIMKGYMESGEFSRGKESIRADGSIVLVGNFEVDVEHQQRIGHLFGPMPPEMKDDTAFMDRIHAFLPGWDVPKVRSEILTDHFGLVSDFLSECWSQLRAQSRLATIQDRVHYGGALSGRDTNAVNKTVGGLLKLLYPAGDEISDEDLEWAVRIALEARRRVKEQQKRIGAAEFRNTHFSYMLGADGVEKFVSTPELQSGGGIGDDPLEPGQVWAISPGAEGEHPGLFRIEVNEGPGSGVKILNKPVPPSFKESMGFAEQNLYARSQQLVGDKDPRQHEFTTQIRGFDAAKAGAKVGVASVIALSTALLKRSVKGGLVVVGELNLGGSIEPIHDAVNLVEIAVEKGASVVLMPVTCRKQLLDLSDDMATKVDIQFFSDARDALLKAVAD